VNFRSFAKLLKEGDVTPPFRKNLVRSTTNNKKFSGGQGGMKIFCTSCGRGLAERSLSGS